MSKTAFVVVKVYGNYTPVVKENLFVTLDYKMAVDLVEKEKEKLKEFKKTYSALAEVESAWEEVHPCPSSDAPEFVIEPFLSLPAGERETVRKRNDDKRLRYVTAVDRWNRNRFQYLDEFLLKLGVTCENERSRYIESVTQCEDREDWYYQIDSVSFEE